MVQPKDERLIKHKRWRHRELNYIVTVLGVYTHGQPPHQNVTVKVDRTAKKKAPRTWNIQVFKKEFEPIGRPMKRMTLWDHL